MASYLVVHSDFELVWPDVPDVLYDLWNGSTGDVEYVHANDDTAYLGELLDDPRDVTELIALGVPVTDECIARLSNLREATIMDSGYAPDREIHARLEEAGVETHFHESEGFWSQSVAELGIGLTISALRQIPQKHQAITESHGPWDRSLWEVGEDRGYGGIQGTKETPFWTHGTVSGTTVRGVGVGNIGSRYLDYMGTLGAETAAYDPYADEPCFHRIGALQIHHLDDVVKGAEIFAPMVPVTDETRGMIDRDLVYHLPEGCLLVLITRAHVTDFDAVRERVTNDEIALATDVYDEEPLPFDDPLLGRANVVHTPHVGGRTPDANETWAKMLLARFRDSGVTEPV